MGRCENIMDPPAWPMPHKTMEDLPFKTEEDSVQRQSNALLAIMAPSLPDVRRLNAVGLNSAGMEAHSEIMNTVDINQAIMMGLMT
ncbi:unnamed protein product [Bubo scandiacus]